ncbi:MAG: hypothetical protein ABF806_02500 [Bifidobacterium psychraerophilum]|uniref:hypothetical protein n=1 Tax=Bifidobacterium psychraerophilum TaxID=218140 RepID=UPI0039E9EB29
MRLNEAVTAAVSVQSMRKSISLSSVAEALGTSRTSFWERLSGRKTWDTEDIDGLAKALGLESSWQLLEVAKREQLSALADPSLERVS